MTALGKVCPHVSSLHLGDISGIFNPINPSFRDLTDISDHFLINNSDNIAGLFLFRFKGFTKIYYEHFERGGLF